MIWRNQGEFECGQYIEVIETLASWRAGKECLYEKLARESENNMKIDDGCKPRLRCVFACVLCVCMDMCTCMYV